MAVPTKVGVGWAVPTKCAETSNASVQQVYALTGDHSCGNSCRQHAMRASPPAFGGHSPPYVSRDAWAGCPCHGTQCALVKFGTIRKIWGIALARADGLENPSYS